MKARRTGQNAPGGRPDDGEQAEATDNDGDGPVRRQPAGNGLRPR